MEFELFATRGMLAVKCPPPAFVSATAPPPFTVTSLKIVPVPARVPPAFTTTGEQSEPGSPTASVPASIVVVPA